MTINEWATVLGAMGTIAAAGVAAYSAHLAWKQVRYQFEPRLLVMPAYGQFRVAADAIDRLWFEQPVEGLGFINLPSENFGLKLANIGNGPAFRVQVATEYDYETLFIETKRELAKFRPDLDFEYNEFGCTITRNGKVVGAFRLPDQTHATIDHLPNASHAESSVPFLLDPSLAFFILCHSCCAFFESKSGGLMREQSPVTVAFRISLIDAGGQTHTVRTTHEITFGLAMVLKDHSEGVGTITLKAKTRP